MDRLKIIQRVRTLTRDFTNSIFREQDIIDFINEGIGRFTQVIPELKGLKELHSNTAKPTLLPPAYRHLLAIYSASRCFGQDERHYQATTLMNEFEVKLEELKSNIESGAVVIIGEDGKPVVSDIMVDYVDLKPYWGTKHGQFDDDEGVEGV